ncbi:hypothetical protein [Flavobacterium nackdongense]|uniref:Uncharacterized protein n=1 Tax=Flavobacterium nackdongense TaxID=2547394 RepID=A0A4P6YDS5_9FLAO|nr:hypothetical protein [Flavobacterium nackdongense]QBN18847.1 hypothetical protein E1750_08525 [Flavobacterium nackdongense]
MDKWILFLRKIKLIENFNIEISLPINDVVKKLDVVLYEDKSSFMRGSYSSKSMFIGKVNIKGFEVRKNLTNASDDKVLVTAFGTFTDFNRKTKIDVKINGFDSFMQFFYGFQIVIYSALILFFLFNMNQILNQFYLLGESLSFFKIIVNVFFTIFVIFIITIYPYFRMRESIEKMESDLKKELYLLAKE